MRKRKKYPLMGKKVYVKSIYIREINKNIATWKYKKLDIPKIGWVVGYRKRFNGKIVKDVWVSYEAIESGYFIPSKTISCLMVTFSPLTNPVPVPLDEIMELL